MRATEHCYTEHCCIVTDEQILHGEPIIKGTRTPVRPSWRPGGSGFYRKRFPAICHTSLWRKCLTP